MSIQWMRNRAAVAVGAACLALATGCDRQGAALESIKREGKLVVLTRNAPTTYYEGREAPEGFEYALASQYADSLGVEAAFKVFHSVDEVLAALQRGEGHLAAAGITRTDGRKQHFRFGPAYFPVQQKVVCRRGGNIPGSVEQLTGLKLRVTAGTSYAERLEQLSEHIPELAWQETSGQGTEQLLRQVWRGEIDCTVADSNIVAINRRYMPELLVAFPLSEVQQLTWALRPEDEALEHSVRGWFEQAEQSGLKARLYERYYGYTEIFDYVDVRVFLRRLAQRLPRYQSEFRQAAEREGLPWTLLAAQAYQESHWNPRARSPTGVRGIMMLTQLTAGEVGVSNRLHAGQSIRGGARYLARMVQRLPDSVRGQDRFWLALAAYNVGYGHLRDARTLARQLGRNPDRWVDLKEVLPLLAEKEHYRNLRYGYARGWEPVEYVQRIRDYRDLLEQQLAAADSGQAQAGSPD